MPLHKRSLGIRDKTLGPEHPDGIASLNNLAFLHKAEGHYAEAEPLYNRALTIWEKAVGPGHPNMALGLENYAALLEETGRGDAAKLMKLRAKAIRAKHAQENPVE